MFKVTRYFVSSANQAEAAPGGGPFRERAEAAAVASAMARRGVGARVFGVTGEPVFDLWDEPLLLADYSPETRVSG